MAINNVYFSVTGDCQNVAVGAYNITIDGTAPDYRINFINPGVPDNFICDGYSAGTYVYLTGASTTFTAYNLTAGTYNIEVYDNTSPTNDSKTVGIVISSGSCVSIDSVSNTSCGLDNGSVTASTLSNYSNSRNFYLYDSLNNLVTSANTQSTAFTYTNSLSAGTYYVVGDDGAGCNGTSESFVVKSSSTLSYSLYTINNSACNTNLGKIYVSGLTGVYPFTYQWSNGQTGVDNISGLTAGAYSVTITDGNGCSITKSTIVNTADPLSVLTYTFNPPSCANNDGEVTIYFSGGSPPYNVQCSNGDYQIIFDNMYTFQNLPAGVYTFTVVDAGLCTTNGTFTLLLTNDFVVQSVNVINSNCFGVNGELQISILGASSTYTYILSGTSSTSTANFTLQNSGNYNFTIPNLVPDTYNLTITSTTSTCLFSNNYVVGNTTPYTISTSVTGTTCGSNNGTVEITMTTGYTPDTKFTLISNTINNGQFQTTSSSAVTFTNLQSGNYTVTAVDTNGTGCIVTNTFDVPQISTNLDFLPLFVNGDQISLSIIQGQPPFTLYWSSSTVGGLTQTGTTITGLTPADYNVTVYDSTGCFLQSETVTILSTTTSSYSSNYNICQTSIGTSYFAKQKKISQVFFDGYIDSTTGSTQCDLVQAVFTSNIYVNNTLYQDSFYTATTVTEVLNIPDSAWETSIQNTLTSVYGIGEVLINVLNNQISINTDCNLPGDILAGAYILIDLVIDYEIKCKYCNYTFENCDDPTDEITVGIVDTNFSLGDVIKYNNICYKLNTTPPVGFAVDNKVLPDFTGLTACLDCASTP